MHPGKKVHPGRGCDEDGITWAFGEWQEASRAGGRGETVGAEVTGGGGMVEAS